MSYDGISSPLRLANTQAAREVQVMFAVELKFESTARGAPAAKRDAISSLIGALVRNGNLLEEFLVAGAKEWTVYGVAPARDAFHQANWNEFIRRQIERLSPANLKRPRIRFLGIIPETAPACGCIKPGGLFLFTTFLHIEPPVRCIQCNGIVPLYRLPRSTTGEQSGLLAWKFNYQACDTLQMNCTVGERFGERQMSDPASDLSRLGQAVCKEIQRLTGRPAYYYLYQANARSHSAEVRRKCPSCQGSWLLKKPLHGKFDFRCDKCRLLSNIAWNVR
jgi:predicted  nucleic acid-binding Zn ribbon protein